MRKVFSMVSIMKKMAPVVVASVFLLPLSARAEIKAGSVEVSPFVGYNFFEKGQNLENRPVFGGRLGYNFTNHLGIEGTWEFIQSNIDDKTKTFPREGQFTSPIDKVKINMYHLDLLYHFMSESNFNPFIVAGYGAADYSPKINNKNMSIIDFGVGAKYWVADNIALRLDLRDNMVLDESIHNIETTLGIVFAFGGEKKPVAAKSDTTAPKVIFTVPVNSATAVPINQRANAAFSEDMDPATITAATFTLKQGVTPVSGKVTSIASTATFVPASYLEKGKAYTATITTGAKDLAGNALANNYEWRFTAGLAADTTAPTVTFTSPVKGATAAPVNQNVNAAFSEDVDPATITAATFILKQGKTPVSGKVTSAASTATFTPARNFEKGKAYTATITTGAKDLTGNALASDYVWNFTALAVPKVLATLQNSHFLYNSADISEDGKTILNHNIKALKDNPKMKLRILGFTSAAGSEEYNQELSERRASAVKEYLVKTGGINENRLTTIGHGETNPAKYEADPSDKLSAAALANMRVIIEVVED